MGARRASLGLLALFGALSSSTALAGQAADEEQPTTPPPRRPSSSVPRTPLPEPEEEAPVPKHTAVYYLFGFGAPVGLAGFEGVRRLGDFVEISAGFGGGVSAGSSAKKTPFGHALQWAVMPRLRFGNDWNALTVGAGLSGGNYGGIELFGVGVCGDQNVSCEYPTKYVLWANFEVAGEWWWHGGFAMRLFLGLAEGCTAVSCDRTVNGQDLVLPYFGIGLGYAW